MKRSALTATLALAAVAAWAGYVALPLVEGEQTYERGPARIAAVDVAGTSAPGAATIAAVRQVEAFEYVTYDQPYYWRYELVTRILAGGRTVTAMESVRHETPYELTAAQRSTDGGVTYETYYVTNYLPVRQSVGFKPVTNLVAGVAYADGAGRLYPTNAWLFGGERLVVDLGAGGTNAALTVILEK